jgi:hypothetical protein
MTSPQQSPDLLAGQTTQLQSPQPTNPPLSQSPAELLPSVSSRGESGSRSGNAQPAAEVATQKSVAKRDFFST